MLIKQFTKEADGIQEVRGSIPLISTRKTVRPFGRTVFVLVTAS